MPHSYSFYKDDVKNWIIENVPKHKRILDVGPGVGTYSTMLRTHGYRIDAVVIFHVVLWHLLCVSVLRHLLV